jgi:hypothetical protein
MCTLYQIVSGDQIENTVIGWACNTYGGQQRCVQGFGG